MCNEDGRYEVILLEACVVAFPALLPPVVETQRDAREVAERGIQGLLPDAVESTLKAIKQRMDARAEDTVRALAAFGLKVFRMQY